MTNYLKAFVLSLVIVAFSQTSYSAWGDYDTTFGFLGASVDGGVTSHYPRGIAVQADGKILVTGYRLVSGKERFFLRRYLSNGQIDTSFGSNGSAVSYALINTNSDYRGERIVVQANGKIAVLGRNNDHPIIWRFHSSGTADTGFAGNGGMKTLTAYIAFTTSIATYSNILYVAASKATPASTVIVKFDSTGAQDSSFGTGGEALTDANFSNAIDVDTVGNILIGGRRRSDPSDYGIERFLAAGVLDPTFTHWGAAYAGWIGSNPSDFVRLANGEFVLNERSYNIASGGATVSANYVRLSSSGNFISRTLYEPSEFVIGAPAGNCPDLTEQQQDGRVILKGANSDELFRFSTDFSTVQTMPCSSYQSMDPGSRTRAILQSDDKMVAAGTYNGYIVLVRTLP